MRTTLLLSLILTLTGCWRQWEREYDQRWTEMADHEDDALAAVRALESGDLDAVHRAGEALAREDKVPMLPEAAKPMLDRVRARAKSIASAPDLPTAATSLATLSSECHACHAALDIESIGRDTATAAESAYLALVWEDEDQWKRTGWDGGGDWSARRRAFSERLTPQPPASPE